MNENILLQLLGLGGRQGMAPPLEERGNFDRLYPKTFSPGTGNQGQIAMNGFGDNSGQAGIAPQQGLALPGSLRRELMGPLPRPQPSLPANQGAKGGIPSLEEQGTYGALYPKTLSGGRP